MPSVLFMLFVWHQEDHPAKKIEW